MAKVGEETSDPDLGQCDHGAGGYGFSSLAHLRGEVVGLGGTRRRLSGCRADRSPYLGTHVNKLSYWLPSFFIFYFCSQRSLRQASPSPHSSRLSLLAPQLSIKRHTLQPPDPPSPQRLSCFRHVSRDLTEAPVTGKDGRIVGWTVGSVGRTVGSVGRTVGSVGSVGRTVRRV